MIKFLHYDLSVVNLKYENSLSTHKDKVAYIWPSLDLMAEPSELGCPFLSLGPWKNGEHLKTLNTTCSILKI